MAQTFAQTVPSPRPPLTFSSSRFPSQFPLSSFIVSPPSVSVPTSKPSLTIKFRHLNRVSASEFTPNLGDILGEVSIFTAAGEPVMLKDLWDQKEGIAVVALLRHFGCFCCWELASTIKDSKSIFDSAGAKLIAVGVGTPNKARILAERAYDILGLYYELGRTLFNPASAKLFTRIKALQKAMKNYTIQATPDDKSSVLQQGGMFVFKGKELLYARKDEGTGDHAPMDNIFNVCCKVPVPQ